MNGNLLEVHAREKSGQPETWQAYRWECFPKSGDTYYYELTGVVAPLIATGKNKGKTNWRAGAKATRRTVVIGVSEHDTWLSSWESKTGKCSVCTGEGKTVESVSVKEGATYRPCRKCNGTGNKP